MCPTIAFDQALAETAEDSRSILFGNGFSIAQAGNNFSYRNLLERSGLEAADPIRRVFQVLETSDFEEVMRALEHAAQIEIAYEDRARSERFSSDAARVRESLIHAIRAVHPGIRFDIPEEQRERCARFLQHFSTIFTLNYDLLLYWVMLHTREDRHSDGCGLGEEVAGFRRFSEEGRCSVYYPHGALHLFLGDSQETKKRVVTGATIVDDIARTIRETNKLPLIVAEGTSAKKMQRINSVPYLRHSYDRLKKSEGSLFIFGHSASEADRHIYNAIAASQITKLFVCVHRPEDNLGGVVERIAPYAARNEDITISYVDSGSMTVW